MLGAPGRCEVDFKPADKYAERGICGMRAKVDENFSWLSFRVVKQLPDEFYSNLTPVKNDCSFLDFTCGCKADGCEPESFYPYTFMVCEKSNKVGLPSIKTVLNLLKEHMIITEAFYTTITEQFPSPYQSANPLLAQGALRG